MTNACQAKHVWLEYPIGTTRLRHVKGPTFPCYDFCNIPKRGNGGNGGVEVLNKAFINVICSENNKSDSFKNVLIQFNTGSRCLNLVT